MAVCTNNINPLYNNYFKLVFNRGTSQLELMCQRANLPGISIGETKQPTTLGVTIPVPTLAATFEPLKVEFIVDNNLENWKSIYSWMRNMTNIENDSSHNLSYDLWHYYAVLYLLDPIDCNSVNLQIKFHNIIPTALSGILFQSDSPDTNIVKATASFNYSYYTLEPDAESNLLDQL
jgi:hypothetical protein